MKIQDIFKRYWYYNSSWHNANCDFIRFDEGICICRTGKNQDGIQKKIDKFLAKPIKVEFYKKGKSVLWKKK